MAFGNHPYNTEFEVKHLIAHADGTWNMVGTHINITELDNEGLTCERPTLESMMYERSSDEYDETKPSFFSVQ